MRYAAGHKDATRQRILDAAVKAFCRQGISDSGVIGIMKDVGLSPAGLYPHFASKDALIKEALGVIMGITAALLNRRVAAATASGLSPLESIVTGYLSERHLEGKYRGDACALAVVGPELARQSAEIRGCVMAGTDELVSIITNELPGRNAAIGRAILALMAGTLQQALTTTDREAALSVLADGRAAALLLAAAAPAGAGEAPPGRRRSSPGRQRVGRARAGESGRGDKGGGDKQG